MARIARSKIQGYGKNERRILRTGTKPIRCKIDFFIFESDQRSATNVEFTTERFGPIHDDANSEPACGGETEFRPAIEKISGMNRGIKEVFALSKQLERLVTDRDRVPGCNPGYVSEYAANHRGCLKCQLLSDTEIIT